jgi:site-specific recombinase XerD
MNSDHLLTRQVGEYIAYKRGLGFKIFVEAAELRRFARYAHEVRYGGPLTTELVLQWISLNPNHTQWYKARRLETVCTFAKYAALFDSRTEIPPKGIFGRCHGRRTPYILSQTETRLLMQEARHLRSPDALRGIAVCTALGLLWSSGLRPSELCALLVSDVDLEKGILCVRQTKFSKTRYVPLDMKTRNALKEYADIRDSLYPCFANGYFSLTTRGTPLTLRKLENAMTLVRQCLSDGNQISGKQHAPRLYDLRHSLPV